MARTPSMSVAEAETILGPRGQLTCNQDNKHTVRKWLTAMGVSGAFAAGMSLRDLEFAYNDTTDKALGVVRNHAAKATINEAAEDDANEYNAARNELPLATPAVHNGNGHGANGGQASLALIRDILLTGYEPKATVDEATVRAIVHDALANITPQKTVIEVKHGDKVNQIAGRVHPIFERVLRLSVEASRRKKLGVLLVGPAGCGKTHLCEQVAKALGDEYAAIHGSAGASESALTGWLLPSDGGKFEYVPAPFVSGYERGNTTFCLDEIDAFDANMLLVANGAIANGHMHIAHRRDNPVVTRGDGFKIIATANTFGTGANPMYSGRNALDAATLDRFIVIEIDYDTELEREIGLANGLTEEQCVAIWSLRDRVRANNLRRSVSTRAFEKVAIMLAAGDTFDAAMATLVVGWTNDEKSKAGVR